MKRPLKNSFDIVFYTWKNQYKKKSEHENSSKKSLTTRTIFTPTRTVSNRQLGARSLKCGRSVAGGKDLFTGRCRANCVIATLGDASYWLDGQFLLDVRPELGNRQAQYSGPSQCGPIKLGPNVAPIPYRATWPIPLKSFRCGFFFQKKLIYIIYNLTPLLLFLFLM